MCISALWVFFGFNTPLYEQCQPYQVLQHSQILVILTCGRGFSSVSPPTSISCHSGSSGTFNEDPSPEFLFKEVHYECYCDIFRLFSRHTDSPHFDRHRADLALDMEPLGA